MEYYNKDINDIYKELNSNDKGLTTEDAEIRFLEYGENQIEEAKKKTKIKRFLEQFNDTMIIILIIVAIIMFFYGLYYSHDYTDTIVITIVVILNSIMGFIQEEKAEITLEGLKKYTNTKSKVKRNNKNIIINTNQIVPGDIIILEAGDKVPADARIIEENNLKVDESPLTGESIPVKKILRKLDGKRQLQDQTNMIFSGTNIVNGTCIAIVVSTGMNTELGKIAVSLNTPYEIVTPLQLKIKEISKNITLLVFIIIIFVLFYGMLNGFKIMEIIMLCVSLAIAAIPEGLPAVITIALSGGTASLAKKKTIVRQMSAVETLGSTNIICSDKTGTITQNKMEVKKELIKDKEMFKYIAALTNDAMIEDDKYIGDPTETCLLEYLKKINIEPEKIIKENTRLMEVPFDCERKAMSTINKIGNKNYILIKGSLDNILDNCKYTIKENKKIKLTQSLINNIKEEEKELAQEALRVLAFAYKEIEKIPSNSDEAIKEETNLIYTGIVGIIDPPRLTVKDSVAKCIQAGIKPIMITGDSLLTATAIAKQVGIINNDNQSILGEELDKYTDKELVEIVKKNQVYARVNPEHKSRIVKAFQVDNKIVAMTGDGVNDAPAIKDAHVGVGMGITGTEVTKSVADIILLDDSFSTIVDAVEEGRRIFNNIRNNIVYSLSSNFAELFIVIISMFTKNTILLPIHILFIDLVTDTIPSICLSFEKSEPNIMKKPPRGINKSIFTPFINSTIIYSAVIETIITLLVYFYTLKHISPSLASTLALFTIVIQEIIYAVSCRNLKEPIYRQGIFSNKYMNIGILILIFIELFIFLTPIGKYLGLEQLNIWLLLLITAFNSISIFLYEIGKKILQKRFID